MAQCEMCGTESEKLTAGIIEGAELNVCQKCLRLGKKKNIHKFNQKRTRSFQSNEKLTQERVVANAGQMIKQTREGKNMRQQDLAKMLQIKDSFLHHIETGDMTLELSLAKKIGETLNISLIRKVRHVEVETDKTESGTMTLGDLIKSKK